MSGLRWFRTLITAGFFGSLSSLPVGLLLLWLRMIEEPTEFFFENGIDLQYAFSWLYLSGFFFGLPIFIISVFVAWLWGSEPVGCGEKKTLWFSNFVLTVVTTTLVAILFGFVAVSRGLDGDATYIYYANGCIVHSHLSTMFLDYAALMGGVVFFNLLLGLSLFRHREFGFVKQMPAWVRLLAIPSITIVASLIVWSMSAGLPYLIQKPFC